MMKQQNRIFKAIWLFSLYLFVFPAWSLGGSLMPTIQLSLQDSNALSKLIAYPKPRLKNRQWLARGNSEGMKVVEVESDYYEQSTNYKRYYKIFCDIGFEDSKHWICYSPNDVIQKKDTIEHRDTEHLITLENKISSTEVLRILDFIKLSGFFSRFHDPIAALKKEKWGYKVRAGDAHTIMYFDVIPTKHGGFLPIDLENIRGSFRD